MSPLAQPTAAPIGVSFGSTYEIIGPDGSRAVIGDRTDPDYVGFLDGDDAVTGLERANVRQSAQDLPEEDGGTHGAFLRGRLEFTIKGVIPPDVGALSWWARQDRLLSATDALRADAMLLWTPPEAPPVQVAFREAQPTRIGNRRPKTFMVAGVSEDPAVYSQELHVVQIDAPPESALGGVASPVESPVTSGIDPSAQASVLNAGRTKTWPVFDIYGPCDNPAMINGATGLGLYFAYELADGEFLRVDTHPRRRTILLNGQLNRYSALDWSRSVWWPLGRGYTDVRFGYTAFNPGARALVTYRDAWG